MKSTVNVRGKKEAAQLLDSLSGRELRNRTRRGVRSAAKVLRTELRSQARSRGDLPKSFAKTATKNHDNPIATSVGPTSPLLNIFEGGAEAHEIGGTGQLLHSQQGEPLFAARGPVKHPGMEARPLIGPVFDAKEDDAGDAAILTIFEGIR